MILGDLQTYLPLADLAKITLVCIGVAIVTPAAAALAIHGLVERSTGSSPTTGTLKVASGLAVIVALIVAGLAALIPIRLTGRNPIEANGLLDSAAAVNVLPFSAGVQLGEDWDRQSVSVALSGNLAQTEARVLVVSAVLGAFPPVRLAFA